MMTGNEIATKYRNANRGQILARIIEHMKEHEITFEELQNYEKENETDARKRLLKIRTKAAVKREAIEDGRRRRQIL